MTAPDGDSADRLYEQVLDYARREIEEASTIMEELRQSLRQVETRVEAAQSIYNAVTARLNLEDELAEEIHLDALPNIPPVEPPEIASEPSPPSEPPEPEEPVVDNEAQTAPEAPSGQDDDAVLSEAERALISEHLRSKRKG